ncbi:MAG TPA: tetraacyldisaccharide 4'-kinase [Gammaproteobacteria bacterium]|nr:tetraacyldisaccharide 4'-kinase [Gammaproteobacteria bacterium]
MKPLERLWYGGSLLAVPLVPLSWLFRGVVALRRRAYQRGLLHSQRAGCPVIVVGNLTVGGSGKTPFVIWLAGQLLSAGYWPGIVSRGYGGRASSWPQQVRPDSDTKVVGDEAVLIARRTGCPMAVGPDRVEACRALQKFHQCDVIISDDGLQHYAMQRDLEIVIIDGARRFGNGHCLPAGPLREPPARLRSVDLVVLNGGFPRAGEALMLLEGNTLCNLAEPENCRPLSSLSGSRVHAVAGIGNPGRFFARLRETGLVVEEHPFPDHHRFSARDLEFGDNLPVVMTEKDAVKCRQFAGPDHWYLPVSARLEDGFAARLLQLLKRKTDG